MLYEIITAIAAIACLAVAADVARLLRDVIHPYFSPVKVVPGPDSAHWFFGNMRQIIDADPSEMHEQWEREYGPVVKYKTFMRLDRLSLTDVRAIGHILADPQCYQKPSQIRRALADILGDGLLSVEGDTHKRQRRVMSPAFGIPQIRAMTEEIFLKKSVEMRDIWLQKLRLNNFEKQPGAPHAGKIEVLSWLNRMTLDIIGSAGFGYDFGSLDETNTSGGELNSAVRTLLRPDPPSLFVILQSIFFVAKLIPTASRRKVSKARATLERVGRRLLEEKKNNVRASMASNSAEKFAKKDFQDRDILTLLVRANMAADLPESSRMTDDEVLAQVPTFILAGHETTSTAVAWVIHALSLNLDVQHKLRAELLECVDGDRPSADTLNGLPYLDAVVRETMRVYSPVPNTIRVATQDDVIPTGKEWVDKNGVQRNDIRVSAGDSIFINILSINRSKEIWGEDAREFKPERWMLQLPSAASSVPGVYGNLLSFLGGNRSCIGWRFSVFEMKAIIYTLVRSFRFELAVSPGDIKLKQSAVTRPYLKDKPEAGPQLPVWVTPIDDGAE